ncbi:MAG: sensor domain-containing diguanylate cyclase [Acidimicrobiales bacterium]
MVFVFLLAGFAALVSNAQDDARQALTDRFATRASLTASFTSAYVDDVAGRERRLGVRLLGSDPVDVATFEEVVRLLELDAAVLLDEDGRLLQVWPARPSIIGRDMTVDYAHLRVAARDGEVGVSEVVESAAQNVPVAAIAVPYDTAHGRRVLSGAFSPSTTPLGAYLASVSPFAGGNAFLIDSSGDVLAAGHDDPVAIAALAGARLGVQEIDTSVGSLMLAVDAVPGTPWRVVLTAPRAELYAPLAEERWAPWALLLAVAVAGLVALVLFIRLGRARSVAATTASTDLLTGLASRRAMDEHLGRAVAHAHRHEQPLTALMIDLDHFKAVNDTHGHAGGDLVLRAAADHLREAIRIDDVAGRWGGEEFLVLLPHTDAADGFLVAERIRVGIADAEPIDGNVTVSIGLAVLRDGADLLLGEADEALYEAKADGRNRTNVAGAPRAAPTCEPLPA